MARPVCVVGGAVEELAASLCRVRRPSPTSLRRASWVPTPSRLSNSSTKVPGLGVVDERLGGGDEGAGPREADAGERPQAPFVEVGEFAEGVVAAPVE